MSPEIQNEDSGRREIILETVFVRKTKVLGIFDFEACLNKEMDSEPLKLKILEAISRDEPQGQR